MTYAPLDVAFPRDDKVIGLSDAAFRIYVEALCFAKENLTDGFVSAPAALRMHPRAKRYLDELVGCGLWEMADGGYRISAFLKRNRSRVEIEELREKRAAAGKLGGRPRSESNRKQNAFQSKTDLPSKPPKTRASRLRGTEKPSEDTDVSSSGRRDPIWDAFVAQCGPAPETKSGRGAWNSAAKEIRDAAGDAWDGELVGKAFAAHRRRWPNIEATPTSVAKHWTSLLNGNRPAPHVPERFVDDRPPADPQAAKRLAELTAMAAKSLEDA